MTKDSTCVRPGFWVIGGYDVRRYPRSTAGSERWAVLRPGGSVWEPIITFGTLAECRKWIAKKP